MFRRILNLLAGNFVNKIVLFLFLPIFTKFLVTSEYAIYANLNIFYSVVGMIYFLGLQQSLYSYYYKNNDPNYRFTLVSSSYITLLTSGILFSSVIILFRTQLSQFITLSKYNSELLILMAVILLFNMLFAFTISLMNVMEKSSKAVFLSALHNFTFIILLAFYAVTRKFNVYNIFLSQLISTTIFAIVSIFIIRKEIYKSKITQKKYYDIKLIKPILRFGIIMLPATLAMLLMRSADRYMITYLDSGSLNSAGVYAVSYKLGMIVQMIVSVVSIIFFPYALKQSDSVKQIKAIKDIFRYYVLIGGIVSALAILFTPEIFELLVKGDFGIGAKLTFIGILSTYLHGTFNIINLPFYANQKANKIAIAVLSGSILNIVLNYILIPRYSLIGAGIASIIAYIYLVMYNYIAVRKMYKIVFDLRILFVSIFILGILAFLNFNSCFSFGILGVKILVLIVFSILFMLYLIKSNKINDLKKMMRK